MFLKVFAFNEHFSKSVLFVYTKILNIAGMTEVVLPGIVVFIISVAYHSFEVIKSNQHL